MRVKLWGTRGLISSPRPETAIFGGNTPCVQILYKDHLILVDTGFGCANLGDELMARIVAGGERLTIHILYTHFHWDHVQGLPFFKPIYFDSTSINLYSPEPTARTLENLNILFDGSYSPFESLLTMQAAVHLHRLEGALDLDGLRVEHHVVDHGTELAHDETYAYRFTAPDGASICLVTDHEARPSAANRAVVTFAKGCDLLIHDGQYLDEEYAAHRGWGHSSARHALENALKIDAGLTLLSHHDPSRNDQDLQALHRALMGEKKFHALDFEFAREEVAYDVSRRLRLPKAG